MGNNIINKKINIANQDYLITKLLGKGYFGNVYEGKNINTNKFVAIKIINIKNVNEKIDQSKYNFKKIVDEEIDKMKKLKCDNTCEFLNFDEDKNYFYLITEKYDTNLKNLLKEKFITGMPIEKIREFFFQLNEILKKMDNLSIIQGDININKILIKYDNENKTDFTFILNTFSFNKYLNYKLNLNLPNKEFIAPEINEGKEFGSYVDIWNLGVMILIMLNKYNYNNLYKQNIPNDLNNKLLEDLLIKMLKINYKERISWNDFFNHEFFKDIIEKKIYYFYKDIWEEYTLVNGIRMGKGKYCIKDKTYDTEFIYDKKTKKTTEIILNLKIEFKLINDIREGDAIKYYNNGDKIEYKYVNNKKEGKAIMYKQNGDKVSFNYVDNKKNGDAIYNYENGEKIEFKFVNDKKEGKAIHYYNDGKVEFTYINNKRNGKAIDYYKTNRIEFQYVDNFREGKAIKYFQNGCRIEFEYKNNKVTGKINEYNPNGDRIEFEYIKGLREGKATEFFTNGDRIEFEYIKGYRKGKATEFFTNGDRIEFEYNNNYRQGKAIEYFINGDIIIFQYFNDNREGNVIEIFKNGNKLTYNFSNDIKQGDAILYYKNGEKIKFKFYNDKKEGEAIQYFTNGDKLKFNYIDDKPIGKAYKYNKDEQLIKEYENINDLF